MPLGSGEPSLARLGAIRAPRPTLALCASNVTSRILDHCLDQWNTVGALRRKLNCDHPVVASVLVVDVGGSHVKVMLASGEPGEAPCRIRPELTAAQMAAAGAPSARRRVDVGLRLGRRAGAGRQRSRHGGARQPRPGWAGFDFEPRSASRRRSSTTPRCRRSAATRAGRMLFLGLGTASARARRRWRIVADGARAPAVPQATFEDTSASAALERLGKKRWRRRTSTGSSRFPAALEPDYVVLGGGNAK